MDSDPQVVTLAMPSDLPQFLRASAEILPHNTTQSVSLLDALHVVEKSSADWILDYILRRNEGSLLFDIINLNN